MDSRDSLDRTSDSIDLTESPVKYTNTRKQIEKINEDTSDNDTDETIIYDVDELKKTDGKDINVLGKGAKNVKAKKGRTAKTYTINIERKRFLKQRQEKALQNAKDRKSAKEYFLTASKASHKANRASKDTQSGRKSNNGSTNGKNTNTITPVDNINNLEIVADNVANAAINAESIDTESTNTDNINNAEIENNKSEDIVMSDDNEDNPAMSDKDSPHATSGDDNAENVAPGETSTED